jgi:hypothetical protein
MHPGMDDPPAGISARARWGPRTPTAGTGFNENSPRPSQMPPVVGQWHLTEGEPLKCQRKDEPKARQCAAS